jgi:hypothetical protein
MKKASILTFVTMIALNSAFAQYTYSHQEATSKGALAIETNGINTQGGSDLISYGTRSSDPNDPDWGLYLSLSNGVGGYYEPFFIPAPQSGNPYANTPDYLTAVTGDFNNDGKVDLILSNFTDRIHFYRGNQSPQAGYFDPPAIQDDPRGMILEFTGAEVNRDGKRDIVVITPETRIGLGLNQGDGTFDFVITGHASGANSVGTGDFDGDGRADLAFVGAGCTGSTCSSQVQALWGEPGGKFFPGGEPVIALNYSGVYFSNRIVDVDSDGRSDLIGIRGASVRIAKGRPNRTFAIQDVPLEKKAYVPNFNHSASVDVADFNGDGQKDIVVIEYDETSRYLAILYAEPDGTYRPEQYIFSDPNLRVVMAGRYNTGTLPDILARSAETEYGEGKLHILRNTQFQIAGFPDCDPRSDPPTNITICNIASSGGSTRFSIAAGFDFPLRKLEVWVDGAKRIETYNSYDQYSFLDRSISGLSPGQHTASVYAVAVDGLKINKKQTFQVGSSTVCAAPATNGINICSPSTTATSPVGVNATGKTANTTVRMELWVDGTKRASVAGNNVKSSITLSPGTHRFSFYAIDSSGSKINVVRSVLVN